MTRRFSPNIRRDWNPTHHRAVFIKRRQRGQRQLKRYRSIHGQRAIVNSVHKLALRRNFSWARYRQAKENP